MKRKEGGQAITEKQRRGDRPSPRRWRRLGTGMVSRGGQRRGTGHHRGGAGDKGTERRLGREKAMGTDEAIGDRRGNWGQTRQLGTGEAIGDRHGFECGQGAGSASVTSARSSRSGPVSTTHSRWLGLLERSNRGASSEFATSAKLALRWGFCRAEDAALRFYPDSPWALYFQFPRMIKPDEHRHPSIA